MKAKQSGKQECRKSKSRRPPQLTLEQHRELGRALRTANEAIVFLWAFGLWKSSELGGLRANAAHSALLQLRNEMDSIVCREHKTIEDAQQIYIGPGDQPWAVS
jgi:hypothetical protein